MIDQIKANLDNPKQLEKLYRSNKAVFTREFNSLYPKVKDNIIAQIWYERLNFESDELSWGTKKEIFFVIVASIIAGIIAKLPHIFNLSPEFYYPRNFSFVVFPILIIYFAWKYQAPLKRIITALIAVLISVLFINFLPNKPNSDTLILACIHLPLFLWTVLSFIYPGRNFMSNQSKLDFLKYNGDLLVITSIIMMAGSIFTFLTISLFRLIDLQIEEFYFRNIAIWGVAASPIVGTFLVKTNPQIVKKVSPVIAKIFTPLALITLVIYLIALIFNGQDLYTDREFLLVFNLLLIGVMALIFFSIAESSKYSLGKTSTLILFALSLVTIIINGTALSAILFRISEWGITPNRLAVLGSNILILVNLIFMTHGIYKATKKITEIDKAGNSIARFLPVYSLWALIVTFIFPVIFNFR